MRLGIDFGTTHTVAALVDRGNFPVVPLGEHDVCPSLLADRGFAERSNFAASDAGMPPSQRRLISRTCSTSAGP